MNSVLLGNILVKYVVVFSVWQIVGETAELAGTKEGFITKVIEMIVLALVIVQLCLRRLHIV